MKKKIYVLMLFFSLIFMVSCNSNTKPVDKVDNEEINEVVKEEKIEDEFIEVSNVTELLNAIKPNAKIKVKSGEYDLLSDMNVQNEFIRYEETYDGMELVIRKVDNLTIIGEDGVKFLIKPRYSNVLTFKDVDNLKIENIIMGHYEEFGECSGGVLYFDYSDNVELKKLDLFGSGTVGITFEDSEKFKIQDTTIRECSYAGIRAINSRNIEFVDSIFKDNTVVEGLINAKNSSNIGFVNVSFINNKEYNDENIYTNFSNNSSDNPIKYYNCNIINNKLDSLYNYKDAFTNCIIRDNDFRVDTNSEGVFNNTYVLKNNSYYDLLIKESSDWINSSLDLSEDVLKERASEKYKKLLDTLGLFDLRGVETALYAYKDITQKLSYDSINDEIFSKFLEYYTKYVQNADFNLFSYSELEKVTDSNEEGNAIFKNSDDVNDELLSQKLDMVNSSGIAIRYSSEGVYLYEEPSFIISSVNKYVTENVLEYLFLRNKENELIKTSNYGEFYETNYSYEIIDRLIMWEKFNDEHKNFVYQNGIINYESEYALTLKEPFEKMNFTSASDELYYYDYAIPSNSISMYEYLIKNYPKSKYAKKYSGIPSLLENTLYLITSNLREYLVDKNIISDELDYTEFFNKAEQMYDKYNKFVKSLVRFKKEIRHETSHDDVASDLVIRVHNSDELIRNIGSDRTLVLDPKFYDIPYNYYSADDASINSWFKSIKNLTIKTIDNRPAFFVSEYDTILNIVDSENINLENIIFGHLYNICGGDVISIFNSNGINITDSLLFGSGLTGVKAIDSENINLDGAMITDSTIIPVDFKNTNNVLLKDSRIYENDTENLYSFENVNNIIFNGVQTIYNPSKEYDKSNKRDFMIKMINVEGFKILNSYFINNNYKNLTDEENMKKIEMLNNILD